MTISDKIRCDWLSVKGYLRQVCQVKGEMMYKCHDTDEYFTYNKMTQNYNKVDNQLLREY